MQGERKPGYFCDGGAHTCGAPRQHDLLLWRYRHPLAMLKDASRELHVSYNTIKVVWYKLKRRKDFDRLCPLCLRPSRLNGGCSTCGAELDHYASQPSANYDTQSPVHRILEGKGLGSEVKVADMRMILRPGNPSLTWYEVNGRAMRLKASLRNDEARLEDPLARAIKSDVLQALKESCPDDQVSDVAARMVEYEVKEFRLKYAGLSLNPKGLREATGKIVLARLEILYPQVRGKLQLPEHTRKVSRLTRADENGKCGPHRQSQRLRANERANEAGGKS